MIGAVVALGACNGESSTGGGTAFRSEWSSDGISCFGEPARLSGPITAERVDGEASRLAGH